MRNSVRGHVVVALCCCVDSVSRGDMFRERRKKRDKRGVFFEVGVEILA